MRKEQSSAAHEAAPCVRVHLLRTTEKEALRAFAPFAPRSVPGLPRAYTLAAEKKALTALSLYTCGGFYLQSASSQLAAHLLAPHAGARILDMCAAPGGKTLHLADLMGNRGEILAVDASAARLRKMRALLGRYGVTCARTLCARAEFLWRRFPAHFDAVLVDAPCSLALPRSLREVKALARRQTYLVRSALACVRPGGVVLYGVCTTTEEETRGVVSWIENRMPECERLPLASSLPFVTGEGFLATPPSAPAPFTPFFYALFRKRG